MRNLKTLFKIRRDYKIVSPYRGLQYIGLFENNLFPQPKSSFGISAADELSQLYGIDDLR